MFGQPLFKPGSGSDDAKPPTSGQRPFQPSIFGMAAKDSSSTSLYGMPPPPKIGVPGDANKTVNVTKSETPSFSVPPPSYHTAASRIPAPSSTFSSSNIAPKNPFASSSSVSSDSSTKTNPAVQNIFEKKSFGKPADPSSSTFPPMFKSSTFKEQGNVSFQKRLFSSTEHPKVESGMKDAGSIKESKNIFKSAPTSGVFSSAFSRDDKGSKSNKDSNPFNPFAPSKTDVPLFRRTKIPQPVARQEMSSRASSIFNNPSSVAPQDKAIFKTTATLSSVAPVSTEMPPKRKAKEPSAIFSARSLPSQEEVVRSQKESAKSVLPSMPDVSSEATAAAPNEDELLSIIKSRANTDQDRLDILDARDKLMKSKGLNKKSIKLKGTCQDLCPERERYSRLLKNQLRLYEKMNESINHKAVVKEYSRSSADQDVPLPHELRPGPILNMTMNHLLANVIDRVENRDTTMAQWYDLVSSGQEAFVAGSVTGNAIQGENLGEWFEYVWSATRAIRKDITQQQLTDLLAVSLVEKSARFHIMCSARLIEEDLINFSPKLNDENLTKCLQTLKHMYEDLKHEHVACPNEPEFRSYEVLMNLNDGDVLRSILTLEPWVRNDPGLKLSVKIFMALNSNNYVKFFKLVRQTSLLQGCILLRYFYQIRQRALNTIVRSYCPSVRQLVPFSLTKLTSMLGFEDIQACGNYCRSHGIDYEVNSDVVYLGRNAFCEPEELPEPTRAKNLIEAKRTGPWSEVINGGKLERNPYLDYVPQDSFDENGFLTPQALALALHGHEAPAQSHQSPEQKREHAIFLERQRSILQLAQDFENNIAEEVVQDLLPVICQEAIDQCAVDECALQFQNKLVPEVIADMINKIAMDALREARNMELARRLKIEAKLEAAENFAQDLVKECGNEVIMDVANETMIEVKEKRRLNNLFNIGKEVIDEIVIEEVEVMATKEAKDALESAYNERRLEIERFIQRRNQRLKRSAFEQWRKVVAKRRKSSSLLMSFPSMPANISVTEENAKLGGHQFEVSSKSKKNVSDCFKALDVQEQIVHEMLRQPLDFGSLLASNIENQQNLRINWKCIIAAPSLYLTEDNSEKEFKAIMFLETIKRKFSRSHKPNKNDSTLLCCHRFNQDGKQFAVCVRCLSEDVLDEDIAMSEKKRREILCGTSALLFIYIEECEEIDSAKDRLQKLISHCFRTPSLPLVIITTSNLDCISALGADELKENGLLMSVSSFQLPLDIFDPQYPIGLERAVMKLAAVSPAPPLDGLEFHSLRNFVECFTASSIRGIFYSTLKSLKEKGLPHPCPSVLIKLFNDGVDYLRLICLRSELSEISWPMHELKTNVEGQEMPTYWNDPMYLDIVTKVIDKLKLPNFNFTKQSTWDDLVQAILSYINCLRTPNGIDTLCDTRIRKILIKCQRKMAGIKNNNDLGLLIPWTDIISACIDLQISKMPCKDPFSPSADSELMVGLFSSDMNGFLTPTYWASVYHPHSKSQEPSRKVSETESYIDKENQLTKLEKELENSRRFEERLKRKLSDSKNDISAMDTSEDSDAHHAILTEKRIAYLPAVALLSPMLGELVSPRSAKLRVETITTMSNKSDKVSGSVKRKPVQNVIDSEAKKSRSIDVGELQSMIAEDLDSSNHFESRLQEALKH